MEIPPLVPARAGTRAAKPPAALGQRGRRDGGKRRRRPATLAAMMCALAVVALIAGARAQDYPTKPITLIVPFTPGGSTSVIARALSDRLSEQIKQPIVIDNRGGAGSTIGARAVARSAPDGATILLGTNATLTIALYLTRNAGYERKDLASVGFIGAVPNVVAVHPKFPARSIAELIAQARHKTIEYGSPGIGTVNHLSGELLAHTAGLRLVHVPYRGAMPALSDLLGGHIPLLFSAVPNVHGHIGAGTVRPLAVTGAKRSPLLPDVPTVAESGLPGFEATLGYGLLVAAGTPRPIIERLNRELRVALENEAVRKLLLQEGVEPLATTPEEFTAMIDREEPKWLGLIKQIGLKAE
ncbi:MAG: tripartite tricarboxylate transporter substrate binding protein [Hyphomicrobiales bacterium]|nr:tripartite tricarboxylate transporter substrate binding protein [Hyphomicrobiales bacterium]